MSVRRLLLPSLLIVALLAQAAPAFAVAPETGPIQIGTSQGFESAPAAWNLFAFNPPAAPPAAAYWGRITSRARTGTGSLWVAGTNANGTPRSLGLYPAPTRGLAELPVDLTDYYSATASYYYNLRRAPGASTPVKDMGKRDEIVGGWANSEYGSQEGDFSVTESAWRPKTYDLTNPVKDANMSRRTGKIWFQFTDNEELAGDWPTSGQGVTIDDVSVKGYKYGPVRALAATRVADGVQLAWQKPYRATGSTVEDEREIAYRVWRSPNTVPYVWDEVTPSRVTDKLFKDTSASTASAYRYFVQACDTAPGAGYGEGDLAVHIAQVASSGGTIVVPEKIEGAGRYDTAVAASQKAFPQDGRGGAVIIAYGRNFPDALGGAAIAGAYDAPLLLTETNTLPDVIGDEIERLEATNTVIIGSTSVVSLAVENAIKARLSGAKTVTRVAGAGRYETAAAVATLTPVVASSTPTRDDVFLAVGDNFPDALAASPAAFKKKWPILLTRRDALPAATIAALNTLQPARVHILGSTGAVPAVVENELKAKFPSVVVDRWQGGTRYATAVDIAEKSDLSVNDFDGLAIATGENFPDALAGGVMQGKLGKVVLLTPTTSLAPDTSNALTAHKGGIWTVRYLGSTSAVAQSVRDAIATLLQ